MSRRARPPSRSSSRAATAAASWGSTRAPRCWPKAGDGSTQAGLSSAVELRDARAETLPFEDAAFDGLTFTYLLRYVDDPSATMRELARVVRPGGVVAMLEFFEPQAAVPHIAWEAYVRAGLPVLGRLASPGWGEVGRFLGPSIRDFWEATPPDRLLAVWNDAGIRDVQARLLSLGGGIVIWGGVATEAAGPRSYALADRAAGATTSTLVHPPYPA